VTPPIQFDLSTDRRPEAPAVDRETFDSTIRTFKHRTPFRPFTVSLVNGERLEVEHPDALAVRDGVGLFVGPGGIPAVFDHEGVAQVVGDLANRPHE
jgi:hypothetical protein